MAAPKISVSMLYVLGESFEKMVEEAPKNNLKYIELLDEGSHAFNKERVATLRSLKASYDLEFTVHAPFAGVNIALHDQGLLDAAMNRLRQSIIYSALLDCRRWIFHPGMRTGVSMFYPGADWAKNLESVQFLLRFAREHGISVAIENIMEPFVLKTVAEFKKFFSEAEKDVGFALDTGHANVMGQVESFLSEFPDKLVHVHAHDNVGMKDQHLGIGYGNINWENFAVLLKKTDFDGIIVVESVENIDESIQRLRQLLF